MRKFMKKVLFPLLFLSLCTATALLVYLHFFAAVDEDLSGEWTAELDLSDQAAVMAALWLTDIEAVSLSLEEITSRMQDLTVQVQLTLEQTGRAAGTFQCNVVPESYEACSQAAYEAFAEAFRELLAQRLSMAGYQGSTDREAVEGLVVEAFGMSTVSYLQSCVPALLPSLEELQEWYDGSGTYEVAEGILLRTFDADGTSVAERYIRQDSCLILSGEMDSEVPGFDFGQDAVIYTLRQLP